MPASICVYCLQDIAPGEATVDHVIARSWYPTSAHRYPAWKVPACLACNNRFSQIEESLLRKLAFCLSPRDLTTAKIIEKVKRSIDPRYGRSAADRHRRQRAREQLGRMVMQVQNLQQPGLLPFFQRNFAGGSRTGVRIPVEELHEVGKKWVRGIHYIKFGDLIPPSAELDVYFVTDQVAAQAFAEIIQHATKMHMGPGIQILVLDAVEERERLTHYAFKIWGEFKLYGTVEIVVK